MGCAGGKIHVDISGSTESPFLIYSASQTWSALNAWGKGHNSRSEPYTILLQKIES